MSTSTVMKELPETSMWHGAISDEDVALVRRRHAEKVEEWLDFADFVTELNALHEKYGIEKGEEGYFAYRKHLRIGYYEKLQTYGPTPDPLDEGCDCIFCRMHTEDEPAQPEDCRVRCADQPGKKSNREDGPHSGPYESDIRSSASGECELPEATLKPQGAHAPRSPAVNQDTQIDQSRSTTGRVRCADQPVLHAPHKNGPHSGPYEAIHRESTCMEADYEEMTNDKSVSRYDSVGGFEIDWWGKEPPPKGMFVPVYPPHPRKPGTEFTPPQKKSAVAKSYNPTGAAPPKRDNHAQKNIVRPGAHALESPLPKLKSRRVRCADHDQDNDVQKIGPRSRPYDDTT